MLIAAGGRELEPISRVFFKLSISDYMRVPYLILL